MILPVVFTLSDGYSSPEPSLEKRNPYFLTRPFSSPFYSVTQSSIRLSQLAYKTKISNVYGAETKKKATWGIPIKTRPILDYSAKRGFGRLAPLPGKLKTRNIPNEETKKKNIWVFLTKPPSSLCYFSEESSKEIPPVTDQSKTSLLGSQDEVLEKEGIQETENSSATDILSDSKESFLLEESFSEEQEKLERTLQFLVTYSLSIGHVYMPTLEFILPDIVKYFKEKEQLKDFLKTMEAHSPDEDEGELNSLLNKISEEIIEVVSKAEAS
jgi:hypothetical protein